MRPQSIELMIESKTGKQRLAIPVRSVSGARFSARDTEGMRRELDAMIARVAYVDSIVCSLARDPLRVVELA